MKKIWISTVLAGIMVVPSLFAASFGEVSTVGGYGPYQTGSGGEFTLSIITTGDGIVAGTGVGSTYSFYNAVARNQYGTGQPNFQTFCVEGAEFINPNRAYDTTTAQSTMYGGTTLTVGAAWLYAAFASGQLAYNYGAGRTTSADALQRTIWALMGQEGQNDVNTASDPYTILVKNHFGNWGNALAANGNQYPVQVLRLWEDGDNGQELPGNRAQDQLVLTGEVGHNIVPDGGLTVGLLGFALTGLSLVNRKFRK